MSSTSQSLQEALLNRHIDQLRHISLPPKLEAQPPTVNKPPIQGNDFQDRSGLTDFPVSVVQWMKDIGKVIMRKWIEEQKMAIGRAKEKGGNGGEQLDWDLVMFTFLESTAMYLRDDVKVERAISHAQNNTEADDEEAKSLIKESQRDIEEIAEAMGLKFYTLCDLEQKNPSGHFGWSGAFFGAFVYENVDDPSKSFVGVASRGSLSIADAITDVNYTPYKPLNGGGVAFDCEVHQGFYAGLFGDFNGVVPYNEVLGQLALICEDLRRGDESIKIKVHVTGHSLGGAYATLAYAESLRLFNSTSPPNALSNLTQPSTGREPFRFLDLYALAAPRVGELSFAQHVRAALWKGQQHAWRICNDGDVVPTVPPPAKPLPQFPYVHIDGGVKIFSYQGPEKLQDEIDSTPVACRGGIFAHAPCGYYQSICKAMQSAPLFTKPSFLSKL